MKELIHQGRAREVPPTNSHANSLILMSEHTMATMQKIELTDENASVVFREMYECLRQTVETLGYRRGYRFDDHDCLQVFIDDTLRNPQLTRDFERYRKIRNGISYYGERVSFATASQAKKDIPKHIKASTRARGKKVEDAEETVQDGTQSSV